MYSSTYGAHQKLPPSWNIPEDIALNLEPGGPLGAERKQQELFSKFLFRAFSSNCLWDWSTGCVRKAPLSCFSF